MNEFVAVLIAVVAYSFIRGRARRWIVRRWVADQLSDRTVAVLMVLSYLAPLLVLAIWVSVAAPGDIVLATLVTSIAIVVLVAVVFGLVEYATQRRVKDRIRQDSDT
jgi:protein-S-isoprenylcysteine O-methyltransferase Ste14